MKQPFNPLYELERISTMTPDEARRAIDYYREAARRGNVKFGKRFVYRFEWLESAMSLRYLSRKRFLTS